MVKHFCDMCKKESKTSLVNLPSLERHGMDDNGYPVFKKIIRGFDICDNCLNEMSKNFYEKLKW